MPVTILDATNVQPGSLIDARVTVRGVLQLDYKDLAGPALRVDNIGPHLWVSSIADLDVTSPAPKQIPLVPSVRALIMDSSWMDRGGRVRVQGIVTRVESEHVLLVVEVADSSIDFDRQVKVPLYGRNGIPECWLVDLERDHLVVNREPSESGYRTSQVLRRGEEVAPLAFPDLTISVDDILG